MNVDNPQFAPEFPDSTVDDLAMTLQGIINECDLSRAEIIGVLEAVKLAVWQSWTNEDED